MSKKQRHTPEKQILIFLLYIPTCRHYPRIRLSVLMSDIRSDLNSFLSETFMQRMVDSCISSHLLHTALLLPLYYLFFYTKMCCQWTSWLHVQLLPSALCNTLECLLNMFLYIYTYIPVCWQQLGQTLTTRCFQQLTPLFIHNFSWKQFKYICDN